LVATGIGGTKKPPTRRETTRFIISHKVEHRLLGKKQRHPLESEHKSEERTTDIFSEAPCASKESA